MSQYGEPLVKRKLIVCALEDETQGQLEGWDILYTGVGKVNATMALTKKLGKHGTYIPYDLVINYGTAGSRELPIGELVDCTKFIQRDIDCIPITVFKGQTPFEKDIPMILDSSHVEFNPINKHYTCGTGDNFVEDIQYEIDYVDVFDMEAYAIAKVCFTYNIDFISFKYITDNVNESSARDWKDNLADGIMEFKKEVLNEDER